MKGYKTRKLNDICKFHYPFIPQYYNSYEQKQNLLNTSKLTVKKVTDKNVDTEEGGKLKRHI